MRESLQRNTHWHIYIWNLNCLDIDWKPFLCASPMCIHVPITVSYCVQTARVTSVLEHQGAIHPWCVVRATRRMQLSNQQQGKHMGVVTAWAALYQKPEQACPSTRGQRKYHCHGCWRAAVASSDMLFKVEKAELTPWREACGLNMMLHLRTMQYILFAVLRTTSSKILTESPFLGIVFSVLCSACFLSYSWLFGTFKLFVFPSDFEILAPSWKKKNLQSDILSSLVLLNVWL